MSCALVGSAAPAGLLNCLKLAFEQITAALRRSTLGLCFREGCSESLDLQLKCVALLEKAGDIRMRTGKLIRPLPFRNAVGIQLVEPRLQVGDALCPVQQCIAADVAADAGAPRDMVCIGQLLLQDLYRVFGGGGCGHG
ncbi:hypothetical protein [Streptomyces bauhiniae]